MKKGEKGYLFDHMRGRYRRKQRAVYKNRKFREVQLTGKDKKMQKEVDKKIRRDAGRDKEALEQALMAGSIPVDMTLINEYIKELDKLKASNFKGKEEIAKMEVLLLLGQGVMQTLLDMYNKLDLSKMTDGDAMVCVLKFKTTFFNKWAIISEELRKGIETIHEMKYGKKIVTEQGKTMEDYIEGKATEVK